MDHATRTLVWRRPSGPAEPIASVQSRFIREAALLAFGGAGVGQPHILATRSFPGVADQSGTELIYATLLPINSATRSGPTVSDPAWSVQVVAQGSPDEYNPWRCEAPPYPGSVCPYSYQYVRAIGLVTSGHGDVRMFYVRQRVDGRIVADCSSGSCYGHSEESKDGTLFVAWPADGAISQAALLEHVPYDRGTATVDAHGHIHLVLSGYADSRYLMLGAGS